MTLSTLISRLEAASEGSRQEHIKLFAEVEAYLGSDCPEDFRRHLEQARRSGSDKRALGYLLLAALTLVPEGWHLAHLQTYHNFTDFEWDEDDWTTWVWQWKAAVGRNDGWIGFEDSETRYHDALGYPTPALALCIAALKAREQDDG